MHETPLVTIYIPTYNRLNLLKRAVRSVLRQDYKNLELIIVDDGSIDGTINYLDHLTSREPRVRYFQNAKNSGACVSRNKAMHNAKGEFITGLDDDDYFLRTRISDFLRAWSIKSKSTIALCSNNILKKHYNKKTKTYRPKNIKRRNLIDSNLVGNQIFTDTKTLTSSGGFDESLPAWQDLEYWYRLLRNPNSQIQCIKETNYVVDVSHPHERISTNKIENIIKAKKIIEIKHSLSASERRIMAFQLYGYTRHKPTLKEITEKIIRGPTLRNIKQILSVSIKNQLKWL